MGAGRGGKGGVSVKGQTDRGDPCVRLRGNAEGERQTERERGCEGWWWMIVGEKAAR